MSRKERNKIFLDFLKSILIALLTALFGILAFLVLHIEKIMIWQIGISVFAVVLILVVLAFLAKTFFRILKEIEED